jgi:hypothetical protein
VRRNARLVGSRTITFRALAQARAVEGNTEMRQPARAGDRCDTRIFANVGPGQFRLRSGEGAPSHDRQHATTEQPVRNDLSVHNRLRECGVQRRKTLEGLRNGDATVATTLANRLPPLSAIGQRRSRDNFTLAADNSPFLTRECAGRLARADERSRTERVQQSPAILEVLRNSGRRPGRSLSAIALFAGLSRWSDATDRLDSGSGCAIELARAMECAPTSPK